MEIKQNKEFLNDSNIHNHSNLIGYHAYGFGMHRQFTYSNLITVLNCKVGYCTTSNSLGIYKCILYYI